MVQTQEEPGRCFKNQSLEEQPVQLWKRPRSAIPSSVQVPNVILLLLCFSIIEADSVDFQCPANLVSGQPGVPATWSVVLEPRQERGLPFKNQSMEEPPVHLWRKQWSALLPVAVYLTFSCHPALQSLFSVVVSLQVTSATTLEVLPEVSVKFTLGALVQSSTTDDQGAASFKIRWC